MAKTAEWPNFFLMDILFALKGSKLFIIIRHCTIKLAALLSTMAEKSEVVILNDYFFIVIRMWDVPK